jgi:hypothetical protein
MAYDIMLHGRAPADRVRYSGVDPAVHSPPSKMRTYHKPSEGALYANGVDAMLLKVYYEDGKYNKMDLERNWFYTPSGGRSEEFVEELPICVVGTPGMTILGSVFTQRDPSKLARSVVGLSRYRRYQSVDISRKLWIIFY